MSMRENKEKPSFITEVNQGYLVIDQAGEYRPGNGSAVVLGVNVQRDHDRYVVWRAYRDNEGTPRFYSGGYYTRIEDAVQDFRERA
jgi:hypothetical protein